MFMLAARGDRVLQLFFEGVNASRQDCSKIVILIYFILIIYFVERNST